MIIMSNNQWKCDKNLEGWIAQGLDCSAEYRVPFLVKAYTEIMPDVLGLQEVSRRQAKLMMDSMAKVALPDGSEAKYEYISGGDTPMIYRYDKYKLLESGFFRYAEAIPGLEGSFNNGETKSYCWGVFEDRTTKKLIAVLSTHLWWKSSAVQPGSNEARAYQIRQAAAKMEEIMAKYNCPGVMLGDFNASIDSLCLEAVFSLGWKEVHDLATGDRNETRGHHYCDKSGYGRRDDGGTFAKAIDHMVIKNQGDAEIKYFRRLDDLWFDPISDHYPLYFELEY